ncbi:protein S100-A13 [Ambystoma mexicanum]|uniref:protein S100-A13 n=1 Tax=Ambystoma mexicanum TaxID=8296 RepID=UPI0037E770AB
MACEMTPEEKSICLLVQCFYNCSKKDGDKETLTQEEFKQMVAEKFPCLMKDCKDLDGELKRLDFNKDGKMKFSEYLQLIAFLAKNVKREEKKKH